MHPGCGCSEAELPAFLLQRARSPAPAVGRVGVRVEVGFQGMERAPWVQPGNRQGSREARGALVKGYTCRGGSLPARPRDAPTQ